VSQRVLHWLRMHFPSLPGRRADPAGEPDLGAGGRTGTAAECRSLPMRRGAVRSAHGHVRNWEIRLATRETCAVAGASGSGRRHGGRPGAAVFRRQLADCA